MGSAAVRSSPSVQLITAFARRWTFAVLSERRPLATTRANTNVANGRLTRGCLFLSGVGFGRVGARPAVRDRAWGVGACPPFGYDVSAERWSLPRQGAHRLVWAGSGA